MKILPIQEAYRRKFERQKQIKGLEYHASGHCVHIGKLSPGCRGCFVPDPFRHNIITGVKCNLNCPYCQYKLTQEPEKMQRIREKAAFLKDSRSPNYNPTSMSFSGGGETLLYLDVIAKFMELFHEIDKETGKRPWYYLYTNGLLADPEHTSSIEGPGLRRNSISFGSIQLFCQSIREFGEGCKIISRL